MHPESSMWPTSAVAVDSIPMPMPERTGGAVEGAVLALLMIRALWHTAWLLFTIGLTVSMVGIMVITFVRWAWAAWR